MLQGQVLHEVVVQVRVDGDGKSFDGLYSGTVDEHDDAVEGTCGFPRED